MVLQSIRRRWDPKRRFASASRRQRRLWLEELEALCLLSGGTVTAGPLTPPLAPPVSSDLVSLQNPNQNLLSDPTDPTFYNGNLFVPNINSNTIAEVTTAGHVSTFLNSTLTGTGGSTVNLSTPDGVAFDSTGNLYVANFHGSGNSIEVTPQGTAIPFADIPNPNGPVFDPTAISTSATSTTTRSWRCRPGGGRHSSIPITRCWTASTGFLTRSPWPSTAPATCTWPARATTRFTR